MDYVELHTRAFLGELGLGKFEYEPNGPSTFPDFSLRSDIAVECTRLTTVREIDGSQTNLTQDKVPFFHAAEKMLVRIGDGSHSKSFFVCFTWRNPLIARKELRQVENKLKGFIETSDFPTSDVKISNDLSFRLLLSSERHEKQFELGSMVGLEEGGWVVDDLIKGLRDAIDRKSKSARKHITEYDRFWLAVSNGFPPPISRDALEIVSASLPKGTIWEKIILIAPNNPKGSRILSLPT